MIRMIFKQSATNDPSARKQKFGGCMLAMSPKSASRLYGGSMDKFTLNNSALTLVTGNPLPRRQHAWTTPSNPSNSQMGNQVIEVCEGDEALNVEGHCRGDGRNGEGNSRGMCRLRRGKVRVQVCFLQVGLRRVLM